MSTKRRQFTDKYKAKVALEAIRGVKTLSELATEYKVHPTQITLWKKLILSDAAALFSGKKTNSSKSEEELTSPLYEEIGRLKMDIKWLKKSYDPAHGHSPGMDNAEQKIFHSEAMPACWGFTNPLLLPGRAGVKNESFVNASY